MSGMSAESEHVGCGEDCPAPDWHAAEMPDPGDIGDARMGSDAYGQYLIKDAKVYLYQVGSEIEVDIVVPGIDGAIGFDVPASAIRGKGEVWRTYRAERAFVADILVEGDPTPERMVQAVQDAMTLDAYGPDFLTDAERDHPDGAP